MSNWKKKYGEVDPRDKVTTAGKTESFASRNVRMITFLITLGVFLAAFLPIAYMEAREYFRQGEDTRPQMTVYELVVLSEQPEIRLAQLQKFACETDKKSGQNFVLITIQIDPHYTVMASADTATGVVGYCHLLNNETNEELDVLVDDIRAYFGM